MRDMAKALQTRMITGDSEVLRRSKHPELHLTKSEVRLRLSKVIVIQLGDAAQASPGGQGMLSARLDYRSGYFACKERSYHISNATAETLRPEWERRPGTLERRNRPRAYL
jgi:hypothetical protein